ncbi:hypothetical protein CSF_0617 [Campylobacter sputorum bv. faecalis CCUG 20703]|nr:hypothetical protein CSF_0617 [Campylobacter sputorum bv. faecalis CCUG 20703]
MSIALNIFLILFLIIAAYFWYGFNAAIKKNPIGKYADLIYLIHFLSKWVTIILLIVLFYRFF